MWTLYHNRIEVESPWLCWFTASKEKRERQGFRDMMHEWGYVAITWQARRSSYKPKHTPLTKLAKSPPRPGEYEGCPEEPALAGLLAIANCSARGASAGEGVDAQLEVHG